MTIFNLKANNLLLEKANRATKLLASLLICSFIIVLLINQLAYSVKTVAAQEPLTAKTVSAGGSYSLALMENGTVWSWGYNSYGQLGDGTAVTRHTPKQVNGLENIIAISAGGSHSLALKSDGTVWAWGYNNYGQLGDGTTKNSKTPVKVNGLPEIVEISTGGRHSMALSSDGTVWAWGQNFTGRLGDGTITNSYQPVQVIDLYEVVAISAGGSHSLALKSDGTVWAWGDNFNGELGNGRYWSISKTPIQTININDAVAISAGNIHSLAVLSDGTVWAWGNNYNAQLGNGTSQGSHPTPAKVEGVDNVIAITARGGRTIALKSDGTAWGWGYNYYGQLGDGTTDTHKTVPTMVSGLNDIKVISISGRHSLAVLADGTVWGWGFNQTGQVGDDSTIDRHAPVQTLFKNITPVVVTEIDAHINQAKIAPENLEVGDEITIQVTIENSGNYEHQFTVLGNFWKPNNNFAQPDQVFTANVFLKNGEEKTLEWNQIVDVQGEWKYDFTLWKEEPSIDGNLLDQYPEPAGFFSVVNREMLEPLPETTHKVVYIPVKFNDNKSPQPQRSVNELKTWAGMAASYFQQQSFGMIEIESHFIADDWIILDKSLDAYQKEAKEIVENGDYPDSWNQYSQKKKIEYFTDLMLIEDAMAQGNLLKPGRLNFENYANWSPRSGEINIDTYENDRYYDIVAVIQPGNNTFHNGACYSDYGFLALNDIFGYSVWAHELGHGILGFKDYNARGTYGSVQSWGLMGYGCYLNPPAPIMSFNKVAAGWLYYCPITVGSTEPVSLYHELKYGESIFTYEPTRGDIDYFIIEGRYPPDGLVTEDPWHEKPWEFPEKLTTDKGVLLYKVIEKIGEDGKSVPYIYTIENMSWRIKYLPDINHRQVTLKPGDSYIDDLSEVIFTADEVDSLLYINIEENIPYNRKIINYPGNSGSDLEIYANSELVAVSASLPPMENEFDIDLKVYTTDGLMVGMCYDTGEYLVEIPEARTSGNIGSGGPEWISVPEDIDIYYEVDALPVEAWLNELVQVGALNAEAVEDLNIEIEVMIQEIVVDEQGERSVLEKTETLKIAYNNPLESNYLTENINYYFIILATIIIVLIIVSIIAKGIMRDRTHYKQR